MAQPEREASAEVPRDPVARRLGWAALAVASLALFRACAAESEGATAHSAADIAGMDAEEASRTAHEALDTAREARSIGYELEERIPARRR